jgi:hypothetical protein
MNILHEKEEVRKPKKPGKALIIKDLPLLVLHENEN